MKAPEVDFCTPKLRQHEWKITATLLGKPVSIECIHCRQTVTGSKSCEYYMNRDRVAKTGGEE